MAIEMIEQSELPAMMESRIGNRNFVSEMPSNPKSKKKYVPKAQKYLMITGIDQNFRDKIIALYDRIKGDKEAVNEAKANALSDSGLALTRQVISKYGMPSNAEALRERNAAFVIMRDFKVNPQANCEELEGALQNVNAEIQVRNENLASGSKAKVENRYLRVLNDIKKEIETLKKKSQCELIKTQQQEQLAQQETLSALKSATSDVQQKSKTTQYVIYGVGGLLVIGAIYLLLKKQ